MFQGNKIKMNPVGFVKRKMKEEDVKDKSLVCSIIVKKD